MCDSYSYQCGICLQQHSSGICFLTAIHKRSSFRPSTDTQSPNFTPLCAFVPCPAVALNNISWECIKLVFHVGYYHTATINRSLTDGRTILWWYHIFAIFLFVRIPCKEQYVHSTSKCMEIPNVFCNSGFLDIVHRLYFNKITTFRKLDLLPSSGKKDRNPSCWAPWLS
jgi:hypothetical protein